VLPADGVLEAGAFEALLLVLELPHAATMPAVISTVVADRSRFIFASWNLFLQGRLYGLFLPTGIDRGVRI
jgi:hypothetical protein